MSLASYLAAPPRGSRKSGGQVAGASSLCQAAADSRRMAAPCPAPLTVRELCDSLLDSRCWPMLRGLVSMRPTTRKALKALNRTIGPLLPAGLLARSYPEGRIHVDDQMLRSDAP